MPERASRIQMCKWMEATLNKFYHAVCWLHGSFVCTKTASNIRGFGVGTQLPVHGTSSVPRGFLVTKRKESVCWRERHTCRLSLVPLDLSSPFFSFTTVLSLSVRHENACPVIPLVSPAGGQPWGKNISGWPGIVMTLTCEQKKSKWNEWMKMENKQINENTVETDSHVIRIFLFHPTMTIHV